MARRVPLRKLFAIGTGVLVSAGLFSSVALADSPAASAPMHHRVVIAGGGTGGITVAAQLARKIEPRDIVVLDAADDHYYQPAWTLVGGGLYNAKDTVRKLATLIPKGVGYKKANVAKFDPDTNQVTLSDGTVMSYDYLVVATGLENRWPVPGAGNAEALANNVCSIYGGAAHAARTFIMITGVKPGDSLIFTQPPTPIKCGGAPQKIMYLADDYLSRKGLRTQVQISFIIPHAKIFPPSAHYSEALAEVAADRGINVELGKELVEVKPAENKAVFKTLADGTLEERHYNLLHIVPHMGPPSVLRCSKLSNPASGYCDVDKNTLQHVRYPNVFALGDSAGLPTSKTAAAIAAQAPVLVNNLTRAIASQPPNASYDGYTSCPVITGKNSLVLAEFLYDGVPKESFPFDQRKESWSMAMLKRFVFPPVYWHLFLTGRWYGANHIMEPKFK